MASDRDSAGDDEDGVDEAGIESFPASDPPSWTGGRASRRQPDAEHEANDEKMYTSEPVEDDDGHPYVVQQQNVGPGSEAGGGEWPDPHTPPSRNEPVPNPPGR